MRVLFTTQPAYGHFRPLLPLADELRSRNHDVRVATSARFRSVVEDHGHQAEPAGLNWLESDDSTIPEELRAPEGLPLGQFFAHLFIWMTAERLARDVVELSRRWRPDIIVRDTIEFGGALAAEAFGVPVVGVQVASPTVQPALLDDVNVAWNDARRQMGLPPDPGGRGLRAQPIACFAPPALHDPEVPLPPGLVSFGPPPATVRVEQLAVLDRFGRDRPMVYATLGTVFNQHVSEPFFSAVLDGLAGQAVDLVVTVGPGVDPASLGEQPSNVLVAAYLPQRAVMERCAAVVCHGGYGTLLDAIDTATPLVVVPFGADQHVNARSVDRLRMGHVIDESALTGPAVERAVWSLVGDGAWRQNIARVRNEWRALPGPPAAATMVEEMLRRPGSAST